MENIEKLLNDDNREKKRIGYGIHNRASRKKGFRGGVKTPADLLKGKAKKEYIKGGEVVTYLLEERDITKIRSIESIKRMTPEDAKAYIIKMKNCHKMKELVRAWALPNHYFLYKLYKEFNVPVDTSRGGRGKRKEHMATAPTVEDVVPVMTEAMQETASASDVTVETVTVQPVVETIAIPAASAAVSAPTVGKRGFMLSWDSEDNGDEIAEAIRSYANILKSNKNYKITLNIEEQA